MKTIVKLAFGILFCILLGIIYLIINWFIPMMIILGIIILSIGIIWSTIVIIEYYENNDNQGSNYPKVS